MINTANEILGNSQSRQQYDKARLKAGYGRHTKPPGSGYSFDVPIQRQDREASYDKARDTAKENGNNESQHNGERSNQTYRQAPKHEREKGPFGKRWFRKTNWTGNPREQPQAHGGSMGGQRPESGRPRAASALGSGRPFMNATKVPPLERRSRFYFHRGGAKTRLFDPVGAKEETDGSQCMPRSVSPPPTCNLNHWSYEDEEMPDAPWYNLPKQRIRLMVIRMYKNDSDGGSDVDSPEDTPQISRDMRFRRIAPCRRRNHPP